MELEHVIAIVVSLSAAFAYINYRFVGLPTTIGVMLVALLFSSALLILGKTVAPGIHGYANDLLAYIDFDETLMDGMLSLLLRF